MQKLNFKTLAGIASITLLMLAAIEFVCIKLLKEKYNRAFDMSIIQAGKYSDSDGLKPNASTTVWGKKFNTDNLGFRATGKPFEKKKKTWMFIGDSVTQGVGIEDSACFVSLIAAKTHHMNVLNCSMIGWSVHDYKNAIQFLLRDSSNELNISHITIGWCLNDVYGKTKLTDLPAMGNKGWKRTLSDFLHEHYATFRLVKLYATQHSDNYFRFDEQFYAAGNQQFNKSFYEISEITKLAESKNVTVNFLIFPYRTQIEKNISSPAVALFPAGICATDFTGYLSSPTLSSRDVFLFSDEIHFSSLGHHIIAASLTSKDFQQNLNCNYD